MDAAVLPYSLKLHIDIRTVDAAVLLYSLKLDIDIHTVDAAVLLYSLTCILTYIQWMLLYCHTA